MVLAGLGFGLSRAQSAFRQDGQLDPLGRVAQFLVLPAAGALQRGVDTTANFWTGLFASASLRDENRRLRTQAQSWALYQEVVTALQSDNDALRKLLQLKETTKRVSVSADVIAYDPNTHRMTLNKGSAAKIEKGQAVSSADGLIGIIQTVSPQTCQVLLVSSPECRLGAMVLSNPPVAGIVRGNGREQMRMEFLEDSVQLVEGVRVVSSIHSEKIPPYLPIGIVVSKTNQPEAGRQEVRVGLSVRFASVREVLVWR